MLLTNRAIWAIERNLNRSLSLGDLAATCEVSPFHLAHAFGEATGRSVMQYVRGRRLTVAAEALVAGAEDILTLALASGYGSHEAFSRAFRAQFDTTPEAVRRAGSTKALALVPALDLIDEGKPDVATARLELKGPMSFVGLSEHWNFAAIVGVPAQWQRFMPLYREVTDKAEPIPVGVSYNFDDEGEFDYLCAAQIHATAATPPGLVRVDTPACRYAVFQHRDHVATIRSTYSAIWNHWLPASGGTSLDAPILERHNPTFNPATGLGGLEIWLPVAGEG